MRNPVNPFLLPFFVEDWSVIDSYKGVVPKALRAKMVCIILVSDFSPDSVKMPKILQFQVTEPKN